MDTNYAEVDSVADFVTIKEVACHFYIVPWIIYQLAEHRAIPYLWDGKTIKVRIGDLIDFFGDLFIEELPKILPDDLTLFELTARAFTDDENWVFGVEEFVKEKVEEMLIVEDKEAEEGKGKEVKKE